MVVGGESPSRLSLAEVISLNPVDNPVPKCLKTLKQYPVAIANAASASVDRGGQIFLPASKAPVYG